MGVNLSNLMILSFHSEIFPWSFPFLKKNQNRIITSIRVRLHFSSSHLTPLFMLRHMVWWGESSTFTCFCSYIISRTIHHVFIKYIKLTYVLCNVLLTPWAGRGLFHIRSPNFSLSRTQSSTVSEPMILEHEITVSSYQNHHQWWQTAFLHGSVVLSMDTSPHL